MSECSNVTHDPFLLDFLALSIITECAYVAQDLILSEIIITNVCIHYCTCLLNDLIKITETCPGERGGNGSKCNVRFFLCSSDVIVSELMH